METLDAFNTVLEVARLNNFSRAAEKLDLSTSSVSRQVTYHGCTLIDGP